MRFSPSVRDYWSIALSAIVLGVVLIVGYHPIGGATSPPQPDSTLSAAVADTATFAGGCFWCMEPPYDKVDGVAKTISGFAGGEIEDPSYRQVAGGRTEHTETVQVIYDSTTVDYERLLRIYWHNIDPFDGTGQFCDRGSQYRPAIFVHDDRQRQQADETKAAVAAQFDQSIAVEIEPLSAFYAAKEYHQNFYQKNPGRYNTYRQGCGRDARLREIWGDAAGTDAQLARR